MTDLVESVRHAIYTELASTGLASGPSEVAESLAMSVESVESAFDDLAAARHVVLGSDREVVMAHPFSMVNLGFSVMGESTLWWGGCVWDSFAIPHLVTSDDEVLVATTCQGCGSAHSWVVTSRAVPDGDQIAHFLIPMAEAWTDVVRTCANQRVFCDTACLDHWLAREGLTKGYVTDLATVWRLASSWYEGRLDTPYVRREPVAAYEYFRSVGLEGSFWGVD